MDVTDELQRDIIEFVRNFRSTLENTFDVAPSQNKHLIIIPSSEMTQILPDRHFKFENFMFEGIYRSYSIYSCSNEEDAILFLLSINGFYIIYD